MLPDDQLEDYHREAEEPAPHGAWIAWLLLATVAGWLAWAFYAAIASIV